MASKPIVKSDFDGYPFDNFLSEDDKGRRLILNPLTKKKVLLYNKKGKEVAEAVRTFFPLIKIENDNHLDNNILNAIIEKSSPNTKTTLNILNKNMYNLLNSHKNDGVGKRNYNHFIKMMKRISTISYSGYPYDLAFTLHGDSKYIFIFIVKVDEDDKPTRFIMKANWSDVVQKTPFWFKNLDTFDMFTEVKKKSTLLHFIHVFKTLKRVELPLGTTSLELKNIKNEWNDYLSSKH
jgi:hypothetical protein